ncbi:11728_t:CDS:1, partial [Racocetra persica]
MIEYNRKKSKQLQVEIDDIDDGKMKCKKNNYVNGKKKIKINKMIKNNEKSLKKKKSKGKVNTYLKSELEEYLIVEESCWRT